MLLCVHHCAIGNSSFFLHLSMSSHHFVKEGQEPALFIADEVPFHTIAPLLEWVPLVIVTEQVLKYILHWGIKIDVILSRSLDDIEIEEIIAAQHPVRVLRSEENTFSEGIEFLVRGGYLSVNVICHPSEKVFREAEKFGDRIQLAIHGKNKKWSYISKSRFEKWMPENTVVSFLESQPLFEKMDGLIRSEEDWKTAHAGIIVVESKTPFWIGEPNSVTYE